MMGVMFLGWTNCIAVHASGLNPGFVTLVGKKETWNIIRSSIVDIHGGNNGI